MSHELRAVRLNDGACHPEFSVGSVARTTIPRGLGKTDTPPFSQTLYEEHRATGRSATRPYSRGRCDRVGAGLCACPRAQTPCPPVSVRPTGSTGPVQPRTWFLIGRLQVRGLEHHLLLPPHTAKRATGKVAGGRGPHLGYGPHAATSNEKREPLYIFVVYILKGFPVARWRVRALWLLVARWRLCVHQVW